MRSRSIRSFFRDSTSGAAGLVRPMAQAVRARTKGGPALLSFIAVIESRPPYISTRISIARIRSETRRVSSIAAARKTSAPSDFASGSHLARDQLVLGCSARRTTLVFSVASAFAVSEIAGTGPDSCEMRKMLPRVPRPPTLTNRLPSGPTSMSVGANPN